MLTRRLPPTHRLPIPLPAGRSGNAPALAFYAKVGYTPDEIDPTLIAEEDGWEDVDENGEDSKPDYRILSRVL